jgi:hypothetical protein
MGRKQQIVSTLEIEWSAGKALSIAMSRRFAASGHVWSGVIECPVSR